MTTNSHQTTPKAKLSLMKKGTLMTISAAVLLGAGALIVHINGANPNESTDDAYVTADTTLVAPKVAGFIDKVAVTDNQWVHAGQLLATIDDRDYQAALASAQANLVAAKAGLDHANASLEQQQSVIDQARANVAAGQAELTFAQHDLARYAALVKGGAGSVQNAQQARSRYQIAQAKLVFDRSALAGAEHQVSVLRALRDSAEGNVEKAQAGVDTAKLKLSYTRIVAPIDGLVGDRSVRLGAYVNPGSPLLAVVPLNQAYVVGNFRETQLTYVQPDQPVDISVDSLPGEVLHGHVESIAPATGLALSPIQPSNATGNFTKVVQRIPVKIVFDQGQPALQQLRAGMSVVASIETGATSTGNSFGGTVHRVAAQ